MNIPNAKKLVGQLERLPDEKFYLGTSIEHREGGTVACVGGWASILNGGPKYEGEEIAALSYAANWLDLTRLEDFRLFSMNGVANWEKTSRVEVIAELSRMIAEAEQESAP